MRFTFSNAQLTGWQLIVAFIQVSVAAISIAKYILVCYAIDIKCGKVDKEL